MSSTTNVDPARAKESNTEMILAVTGFFHALALLFVGLRTYTRVLIVKSMGIDDYVIIMSALCALGGGMVVFIVQSFYGLGKHKDTISKVDNILFLKVGFFQSIISAIAALALLKISIAMSLLRLSKNKWYSRALWALIAFVILYTIMAWLSFFLYCTPMEGYWDRSLKPKCYPLKLFINFALVNTSFNIFTDVCFATLPIPIIWVLQMKLRTRIYLVGILSLGYLAVIMGIVKAFFQIAQPNNKDSTFLQSIQFWGFLQLNLGIIAACAPSLRPLVGRALKLNSGRLYNNANLYENRYPTGPTGRTVIITASAKRQGYMEQSSQSAPEFELEEGTFSQSADTRRQESIRGKSRLGAVSVYRKNSLEDRSGSEEMILDTDSRTPGSRGIMRTTEVHIER
ncbi:hypothetical protein CGRA01v4_12429 [Colletotrichum graminicola]|uniref:Rhodopsin domain-containing protein n=1 Tax=Colletotrichum graminicola (strain M1.001 / M2 / FGSC 10212) TaxID=645133 RepID=E3QSW0_COLGM|nr:uncharacterized protein GLRG_09092 [Colletotrichum graminicola M1.001]EFQ33948.1 hypothetical protein GLRG_09092 [Colletotrichum graminicola M1.001]WDK21140.1 hypothetical protein CGRA01v4_12429 [Colletotrichum graminicola]